MKKNKLIKVLTLSDNPLSTSGVGIQTKNFIDGLLGTGRFEIDSFAGAMNHQHFDPIVTQEWGKVWRLFPVNGFGTQEQVRSYLSTRRPDILWFMTDPRYFTWLWQISAEIRENVPMVYYNVWDNYPTPDFNKPFWDSNDVLVSMSKITYEMNKEVSPDVEKIFLPLAVDTNTFLKRDKTLSDNIRKQIIKNKDSESDKFIFLWVNRNARRKQPGTLIWWFKEFLDKVGKDKACLLMHTAPHDQYGQNLEAIIHKAGLTNGEVKFSSEKLSPNDLSIMYTAADCVLNISDAEGVGLGTVEAISCETPIIATKTGGLQEQFGGEDGKTGFWVEPKAKSLVGGQDIPYIYEDRISKEDFVEACIKMYNLSKEEREKMGKAGRELALEKYNLEKYQDRWVEIIDETHKKYGSWETRKGFNPWTVDII